MSTTEFDEIRPYNNGELPGVFEKLIADPTFQRVVTGVVPDVPFGILAQEMCACRMKLEFQKIFCYGLLWKLAGECTDDISLNHTVIPDKGKAYTYISNHRGIILNSSFLSILLVDQGMDTVEVAIGDNLLIYPWIRKFVQANKSFIVQHTLTMRQMLGSSARMSRCTHYTIGRKSQPTQIIQHGGRAKDSNDCIQSSVLKVLAMGGEGDVMDRLIEINTAPLAISYEYSPYDYLKAQEFQLERDIGGYKKAMEDDLKNIQTDLFGYKGGVRFQTGAYLNDLLSAVDRSLPKPELSIRISTWIDERIHGNYRLYSGDCVAHDLLTGKNDFEFHHMLADKQRFETYMKKQLRETEMPDKDTPFLHKKLLLMYANPSVDYLAARQ